MPKTRLAVVLILLAAVPSTGFSQLLPRRRVAKLNDDIGRAVMASPQTAQWVADAIGKAMEKALREMDWFGDSFEVDLSVWLFAQLQMDPQLKKRIENNKDPNSSEALAKDIMDGSCAQVLLKQTARFADKLKRDGFTPPALEKIYLEYEYAGDQPFKRGIGTPGRLSPRPITQGDLFESSAPTKDQANKRSITLFEGNRPHDPKNPIPLTVHCALVFASSKDGKAAMKTLWFDMYQEDLKADAATKAVPWKVKNVQDQ